MASSPSPEWTCPLSNKTSSFNAVHLSSVKEAVHCSTLEPLRSLPLSPEGARGGASSPAMAGRDGPTHADDWNRRRDLL
jgi:hypothetical protein